MNLDETIVSTIKECNNCHLRVDATQVVVGDGTIPADVLIFGEAPGKDEDEQGLPFIGASGQILRSYLKSINFMDHVYISNIVKCRPPFNRTPTIREAKACSRNTDIILNAVKPKLIVTAGQVATEFFIDKYRYRDVVGKIVKYKGFFVYVIRHPAYALHNRRPEIMEEVRRYILDIPAKLQQVMEYK